LTLGSDFNKAETWSKSWSNTGNRTAPYSPGSGEINIGIYSQFFGDIKNGFVTATAGLRYDRITSEILKSSFFPNSIPREESFDVFAPSYGLTVSPLKFFTDSYSVTFYHNLGKGFVPQPAGNIAGFNIGKPDTTGHVEILQGNPDLKPEQNINVDGGLRVGLKTLGISLGFGFYRSIVENFSEYDYLTVPSGMTALYNGAAYPVSSIKTYKNNDDQTIMAGLEWNFEWNILGLFNRKEKLVLSTNGHAVLRSEVTSGNDKSEIKNVRNPNFTIGLTYDDSRFLSARLITRYSGEQTDTDWTANIYPNPDVVYPPFLITDFALRTRINEHHAICGQISNVTDENYYEKRGYNLPGRTFGLEYELSF
jgi:outer membrane receptor protein involved in Fe transport